MIVQFPQPIFSTVFCLTFDPNYRLILATLVDYPRANPIYLELGTPLSLNCGSNTFLVATIDEMADLLLQNKEPSIVEFSLLAFSWVVP